MTVKELYEGCEVRSNLKVIDGATGKVLCYAYRPEEQKHEKIGRMRVLNLWAEMQTVNSPFGNYARPYMCAYAIELWEGE